MTMTLEEQVAALTKRVEALEQKSGKAPIPLKKRVKVLLEAENNNLHLARNLAKDQGDTEAVKAIEQLMAQVT